MNTQETIQALINQKLLDNAKMQAYDGNIGSLSMLIVIATNEVPKMKTLDDILDELRHRGEFYSQ